MTKKKERRKAKYRSVDFAIFWANCPTCGNNANLNIGQNEDATKMWFRASHCGFATGVFYELDWALEDWEAICRSQRKAQ